MSFLLGLGKHLTPSSIIRGQQSRRRRLEKREKKIRNEAEINSAKKKALLEYC